MHWKILKVLVIKALKFHFSSIFVPQYKILKNITEEGQSPKKSSPLPGLSENKLGEIELTTIDSDSDSDDDEMNSIPKQSSKEIAAKEQGPPDSGVRNDSGLRITDSGVRNTESHLDDIKDDIKDDVELHIPESYAAIDENEAGVNLLSQVESFGTDNEMLFSGMIFWVVF